MLEKEFLREKETSALPINYYEASMKINNELIKRMREGRRLIKGSALPWEQDRQGFARFYCHDAITGTANDKWHMFVHEIRTHSGKHVHQGGLNLFVLKGKGHTMVDGVRFDWQAGDLICLPIKKGGVEHQHFNEDNKPSRWLALINYRLIEAVGRFMVQKVESPDWIKLKQK